MKKYLVSYFYNDFKKKSSGFGNGYFETESEDEDIYTQKSVVDIENSIEAKNSFEVVVILNIIPLNG